MNIYIVKRKEETVGWDEMIGYVVAAESDGLARALCVDHKSNGDEPRSIWHHPDTTCTPIGVALPGMVPSVLFESFNAA